MARLPAVNLVTHFDYRIAHELLGQLGKANRPWTTTIIPAPLMHELVIAVENREITGTTGKAIIKHLVSLPESASFSSSFADLLAKLGLTPSPVSVEDVTETCKKAINNQPKAVADFKKGNEKVVMRLVGEVMKLSGGKADAMKAKGILLDLLKE